MNIGEASKLTGISRDMLRHYEKLGILSPGRNPENHYRDYSTVDISNAVMIKQYSSQGISLKSLARLSRKGDVRELLEEMDQTILQLDTDLEWTRAKLENVRDYRHLFSLIREGSAGRPFISDVGECPASYYYPRPEDNQSFAYTDPAINGAVRMVFRIAPGNTQMEEFPSDLGILSRKKIESYPFTYIEIPAHRFWRTVISQAPEEYMNGYSLRPILQRMRDEGYTLQGGIFLSQIMSASADRPQKLVSVECDIGPVFGIAAPGF